MPFAFSPNASQRSGTTKPPRCRRHKSARKLLFEHLEDRRLLATIYSANMDTNPGWTLDSGSQWAWGTPQGFGGDPTTGHTGTNVIGYNLAGAYTNNMGTTLYAKTPAINCSGYTGVTLDFWRWLGVESSTWDQANIQVSNDGSTWTPVWAHSGSTLIDTTWTQLSYDISAVADNQATVYVRFGMGPTDSSVTYGGWNIDDLTLAGTGTTPPTQGARGVYIDDVTATVHVFDVATDTLLGTVALPGASGNGTWEVAITPDQSLAFVSEF